MFVGNLMLGRNGERVIFLVDLLELNLRLIGILGYFRNQLV